MGDFVLRVYGRNWRKKKEGSNDVNILSSHKRNNKKYVSLHLSVTMLV